MLAGLVMVIAKVWVDGIVTKGRILWGKIIYLITVVQRGRNGGYRLPTQSISLLGPWYSARRVFREWHLTKLIKGLFTRRPKTRVELIYLI